MLRSVYYQLLQYNCKDSRIYHSVVAINRVRRTVQVILNRDESLPPERVQLTGYIYDSKASHAKHKTAQFCTDPYNNTNRYL